jgi:hypothetical protein
MVKDAHGQPVKVGDLVLVPATVSTVFGTDGEKANVTIVTEHKVSADKGQLVWTLNARLLEHDEP